jgi:hypothetical protein
VEWLGLPMMLRSVIEWETAPAENVQAAMTASDRCKKLLLVELFAPGRRMVLLKLIRLG